MSYNIIKANIKLVKGLTLPLNLLSKHCDRFDSSNTGTTYFQFCESDITGFIPYMEFSPVFIVSTLHLGIEGSGIFMRILEVEILPKSFGELVMTRVWEGGEVDKFSFKDGIITIENIDI